jgi:hypothetical protein
MTINEVAAFLGYTRDKVKELIDQGMPLPVSRAMVKLASSMLGGVLDISEEQLDEFIARFAAEEPDRHPPTAVRRELLVESGHACAICRQSAPPQFHHMLEWSKVRHHNPQHMLHLCGACHDKCSNGQIDRQAQIMYKARLRERVSNVGPIDPYRDTKRAADKQTLEVIFGNAPRPVIERFLYVAYNFEQIFIPSVFPIGTIDMVMSQPTFHMYDKELQELIRDFSTEIIAAIDISGRIFRHYHAELRIAHLCEGTAYGEPLYEKREEFQRRIVLAQHSFSVLNCYIREEYPELDLDAIDRAGVARFNAEHAEPDEREEERRRA